MSGNVISTLKTALVVTLVTLLIWVFAEGESLTSRGMRVDVVFETEPGSDRVVEVPENQGWLKRVDLVFEGSTAAVVEAEAVFRRTIRLRPGMEGVPAEPGEKTVDLNAALRAWPELRGKGVTIARVDPPTVRIRVDEIVQRELRVVAEVPASELDGQPEVKPETARVFLPSGDVGLLTAGSVVRARVTAESIARLVPGRRETIANVLLEPPLEVQNSRRVRVEPLRAEVSLSVRSRVAIHALPSVPVSIVLAAGEQPLWEITVQEEDRAIRNVSVAGPVDLIEQLKKGNIVVAAQVVLSFDELTRGIASKQAVFTSYPPAAELEFRAENSEVRLHIRRRSEPEPAAEPTNGSKGTSPASPG